MKGQPGGCPDLLSEINVYMEVVIGNSITADVIENDCDRILLNTIHITPGILLDIAHFFNA